MRPPSKRRTIWIIAIATGLLLLAVVVLPFLASTRLVSDRIAEDMGEWTGLDVTIGSPPQIHFWPDLQADFADVTLALPGGGALMTAERVEVELSPWAALGGDIDFSMARFIRPTIRLAEGEPMPVLPAGGRIARSIGTARQLVAEDGATPDLSRLPDDDFGVVEFAEGRVVRVSGSSEQEIASGLSGRIDWETLDGRASMVVRGLASGTPFALNVSSANPLLLFGGGASPLRLTLESQPLKASFDGTANLGTSPYADGRASLSAASTQQLLAWSGREMPVHEFGAISLEGRVLGDSARIRLEEATISLGGAPARGALDLMLAGKLPKLSGTLAFETLDIGGFLSAFTPLDIAEGTGPQSLDTDFATRLALDLRLSAQQAKAGAIALADVAATARVDQGFAAFDISDARAFGGDIQAGLRFDRKDASVGVELRLLASDIDGGAFGTATGLARLIPQAHGAMSVILKSEGDSWGGLLARANGSVSANFGQGALPEINLDGLVSRARESAPFPLQEVASGVSPISGMDLKSVVAKGTATLERVEIRSQQQKVTLKGTAGIADGVLALLATAEPAQATSGAETPAVLFQIDGPWQAATVTPIQAAAE